MTEEMQTLLWILAFTYVLPASIVIVTELQCLVEDRNLPKTGSSSLMARIDSIIFNLLKIVLALLPVINILVAVMILIYRDRGSRRVARYPYDSPD